VKRKRFSVEQIVAVLKQAEVGVAGGGADPPGGDHGADPLSLEEAVQDAGSAETVTMTSDGTLLLARTGTFLPCFFSERLRQRA
jgi:hypothetical protein